MNRGGSYIDSPEVLKNKRAMINPKNKNNECFKYAITIALNHERYEKDPQRISKSKPFIDQYKLDMKKTLKEYQKLSLLLININWKGIEFPSHSKDWKKFEKNNKTIALNILYVPYDTEKIRYAYISKYNNKYNNQVILLMITGGKKQHYLAVKSLSKLLRQITSNHNGNFYCLNCLHSYRTKEKLKKHEKVSNNHDYCYVKMPKEYEKNIKIQSKRKVIKSSVCDLC